MKVLTGSRSDLGKDPGSLNRSLPLLPLILLGMVALGWGIVVGWSDFFGHSWALQLLGLPQIIAAGTLILLAAFGLGFWAHPPRNAVFLPVFVAGLSGLLLVGFAGAGVLMQAFLTASLYAFSLLATRLLGGFEPVQPTLTQAVSSYASHTFVFTSQLAAWISGLLLVGTLAGVSLRALQQRGWLLSGASWLVLVILGGGISLGWHRLEILGLGLAAAAIVAMPLWIFEQMQGSPWGKSGASLVSMGVATIGVSCLAAGWWGISHVLPWTGLATALLLLVAPLVVMFEQAQRRGLAQEVAVLLSLMTSVIPALGLALGIATAQPSPNSPIQKSHQPLADQSAHLP
ncbi:MAG: hypothetical protein NW237_06770 [Cyanobacteriota bacterium]|nr:hypothetical protein [Cyanobacteriota bacterium]